MDFAIFSASRLEPRCYNQEGPTLGEYQFESYRDEDNPRHKTGKEVFDALLSTAEAENKDLSENLINANIYFNDLSSLTRVDLDLLGCKDDNQQNVLLDFFQGLPKQDRSYEHIVKADESEVFNEVILRRATTHLDFMRSALAAANYKLQIITPEDVVVNEKNFASRFVVDALEELQRVTNEIDAQLDALAKEATPATSKDRPEGGISLKFSVLISAVLGTFLGFFIWKTVKTK